MSIDPGSSPPSQAVVQITMGRIYDVVTETRQEVRDLTNSVKILVEHVGDHETRIRAIERDGATTQEVEALRTDHGSRLSAVEKKVWMGLGIGLVAASGCSGLITYLATVR